MRINQIAYTDREIIATDKCLTQWGELEHHEWCEREAGRWRSKGVQCEVKYWKSYDGPHCAIYASSRRMKK